MSARHVVRRVLDHAPRALATRRRLPAPRAPRTPRLPARLSLDEGLIALLISAMAANGHVSPAELERAHHLIWSTRRFRRQDGDEVSRIIHRMRALLEASDIASVLGVAVRAIPARHRASVFALAADLLLADGRLDAHERLFLRRLGSELAVDRDRQRRIINVVLLKNEL